MLLQGGMGCMVALILSAGGLGVLFGFIYPQSMRGFLTFVPQHMVSGKH